MQLNCALQNSWICRIHRYNCIIEQTWVGITVHVSSNSLYTRIAPGQHPLMARTILFQSFCFEPFTQSETVVHRVIVYFAFWSKCCSFPFGFICYSICCYCCYYWRWRCVASASRSEELLMMLLVSLCVVDSPLCPVVLNPSCCASVLIELDTLDEEAGVEEEQEAEAVVLKLVWLINSEDLLDPDPPPPPPPPPLPAASWTADPFTPADRHKHQIDMHLQQNISNNKTKLHIYVFAKNDFNFMSKLNPVVNQSKPPTKASTKLTCDFQK